MSGYECVRGGGRWLHTMADLLCSLKHHPASVCGGGQLSSFKPSALAAPCSIPDNPAHFDGSAADPADRPGQEAEEYPRIPAAAACVAESSAQLQPNTTCCGHEHMLAYSCSRDYP